MSFDHWSLGFDECCQLSDVLLQALNTKAHNTIARNGAGLTTF